MELYSYATEVHFFALKKLQPSGNYSTCYLVVDDIDVLYEHSRAGLKKLYNKIPFKGFPRINPLKDIPSYGVRQFIIVDPNGNYIRVGQPIKKSDSLVFSENNTAPATGSPLAKAYELASKLADAKGDFALAAQVLDKAIGTANTTYEPIDLLKVLILRADISARLNDAIRLSEMIKKSEKLLDALPFTAAMEERRLLAEVKDMMK